MDRLQEIKDRNKRGKEVDWNKQPVHRTCVKLEKIFVDDISNLIAAVEQLQMELDWYKGFKHTLTNEINCHLEENKDLRKQLAEAQAEQLRTSLGTAERLDD